MNPFVEILWQSFSALFASLSWFLPNFIGGAVFVALGFIVGISFEKVIAHAVQVLKVDAFFEGAGVRSFLSRGGLRLDFGLFLGGLVKWFIIIAFLMAGLQVVGLTQVSVFLRAVILSYIPQVTIAALMLLCAAVGAQVAKKMITHSLKAFHAPAADFLGAIASFSIWAGTFIFIFTQLGIADDFTKTLFIGLVGMVSLAFGLAFGLGGRDAAARLIEGLPKRTHETIRK